ncbi:MAG: alpha-N-acetylglucosaminidase C-terminal domain-containing protein, partial [Kiritimatiellae bacterium]|nr:alpha-N-acetylglucosaminidase C-terminal domain-containing protein [Kiritimatiellia bacterium]
PRFKSFLDAIPNDHMVVLDLFCESNPMWDKTDAFCGKPWLWCNVQSFGRRVCLAGWLDRNNDALFAVKHDPKSGKLIGLGFVNEGLCYNPVAYDLMFENAWRNEAVDLPTWIDEYAHHRYGSLNASASRAWRVLLDTVLMKGAGSASVIDQGPKLQVGPARLAHNDKLAEAWRALDEASPVLNGVDTFRFDLVNVARQVLVNHASILQSDIAKARDAKDIARFEQASSRFLQLIADIDELLATRKEFLLGDCLEDARRWGDNKVERAKCEWNARRVLTLWGETTAINDYASKQWAGMFKGYYYLRWEKYLNAAAESLRNGKSFDEAQFKKDFVPWTAKWADGCETYPAKPRGNSVTVARKLWEKYGDALIAGTNKTDAIASPQVSGTMKTENAYLPGTQPKCANASIWGDKLKLSNTVLAAVWQISDDKFRPISFTDQVTGMTMPVGNDLFAILLGDGRNIKSSEMKIIKTPKISSLKAEPDASRLAEHFAGKQITLTFADTDDRLRVSWRGILRDDSNYVRQEVTLKTLRDEVTVNEIVLYEANVPDARTCGTVDGSPVVAGNFFLGYEHPMSRNTVSNCVRCSFVRNAPLKPGEDLTQSFVMGVTPEGQLRRGFLYYLERERAHPCRPYLHYNSWWDISWITRKFTESESIQAIDYVGRELAVARGVIIDGFLFDDGWDDNKTLWQFHSGFPNGFTPLKKATEQYNSGLAVWLSPFGGYSTAKTERLKYGREQGFEINANGFSMAGPRYYERFKQICVEMIKSYGVNHFKFDGLAAGAKATGGMIRDGDAMLRLIQDLRAVKPDVFINQTTGTWPSPFWLHHVDSTWRGGGDNGFHGAGSSRQQWITYRDMITYEGVVQKGPLYPLSSLMTCGIIFALNDKKLNQADEKDFRDEVRSFFGSGTQLQELYITPGLFSARHWDLLAESARWARSHAATFVDVHWVGGDPKQGEAYGWAAWSLTKGALVLRNPSDRRREISVDLGQAFELPDKASTKYSLKSPYKDQRVIDLTMKAGQSYVIKLEPFEVLVFDALPVSQ